MVAVSQNDISFSRAVKGKWQESEGELQLSTKKVHFREEEEIIPGFFWLQALWLVLLQ